MKNNTDHPLQSAQWGKFREKTGVKVIQNKGIQLTIHKIPHIKLNVGYFPKGKFINKDTIEILKKIGKENKCIFIQIEPNIEKDKITQKKILNLDLVSSTRPLFTKYTFILDLTKPEEELLKNMHPKTRYNIRIAQKKGVKVEEDNSDQAFKEYLKLTKETTRRQNFYAHSEKYHRLMWETLKTRDLDTNNLSAHLFKATYKNEVLVTWIVFVYKDAAYYPYGASSNKYREVMASNLMMWEVIRWAKKVGLKKFDMWGSLGPNPDPKDPWFGFHRFKQGYGGKLTEFIGSYDLVLDRKLYLIYNLLNKLRWIFLKLK
jgi:lipid II:glycine glycyltransferase (peptidoglycan interpeptide bridge formation enzyme)